MMTKQDVIHTVVHGHYSNALHKFKAHPDDKNAEELAKAKLAVKRADRLPMAGVHKLYDELPPRAWIDRLAH